MHCNDSRDAAGSGADRHANFGTGQIDPELLVAVVKAADAPVICETADEGRKDDIAFLREHISDQPAITALVRLSRKCNIRACQTRMSSPIRSRRWRTTTPRPRRC